MDDKKLKKEERIKAFNKHLNGIPFKKVTAENDKQAKQDEEDFRALKDALSKGECFYCKNTLTHFSVKKPCYHWLLKPKGFKTKHFPLLYTKRGFHEIQAYLRWVANTDVPLRNINDLRDEKSPSKLIEETIKYKNLEWSFSCTKNCFLGLSHKDKNGNQFPHYHFQMKVNGFVVIKYSAFHVPFNDYDDFCFAVEEGKFDRLKVGHVHGAGMQTFFDQLSLDEIVDSSISANHDSDQASLNFSSIVIADKGTTISGDELENLIEEGKKTRVPMAKLLRKLKNVKVSTIISPGPAVPEMAKRKPIRSPKK